MKPKAPKPSVELRPQVAGVYTLTPSERAPIDKAIAEAAAQQQQALGMINMVLSLHEFKGRWDYDPGTGRLTRIAEQQPAAPAGA